MTASRKMHEIEWSSSPGWFERLKSEKSAYELLYKRGNGQIWLLVSDLEIVHNNAHLNAQSILFISRFKSNYISQIFSVLLRFWPHSILIFNAWIVQSLTSNIYIPPDQNLYHLC